ncbi:CZB domain-containing protein [Marinobacterium arenosum]|uniref:CZB domain-containing protein n=1 Tax=Marinobacterium arenosum TaxID=2862496 RepID=UPI0036F2609A
MHRVITGSAEDAFIEMVKLDHIIWKNGIYRAIIEAKYDSVAGMADHSGCRLGRWYYQGEGYHRYSQCRSFAALEEPHQKVHEQGFLALEAARSGDLFGAAGYLAEMERASMRVADTLNRLNAEREG